MIILKDLVISTRDKDLDEMIKEIHAHYENADNQRFIEVVTNLLDIFTNPVKRTLQSYIEELEKEKRSYFDTVEENGYSKSKDLLDKTSVCLHEILTDEEFDKYYALDKQEIINEVFLDTIHPLINYINQKVYGDEDIEHMENLYSHLVENLSDDYYLTVLSMMYFDTNENTPMLTDELLIAIKNEEDLKKLSDLFKYRDFIQRYEEDYMDDLEGGYTEEEFIESNYYKEFKHLDFAYDDTTILKEYLESLYF